MIRTAQVIPDNERWLQPEARASLDRALEVSDRTARAESDLKVLARKVGRSGKARQS